jgi:transposase
VHGAVRHAPILRWVVDDGRTRNLLQSLLGHLLVFCNRRTDRLKILYWDRDGWAIWYKRLEAGTFRFPFAETGRKEIAAWELGLLLEGIDLSKGQRRKRYSLPATATPQESQPIDVAQTRS